jgi:hypothetical protein
MDLIQASTRAAQARALGKGVTAMTRSIEHPSSAEA